MNIFIVLAMAICAVILSAVLKKSYGEYALMLSVLSVSLILIFVFEKAEPLVSELQGFAVNGVISSTYINILIKSVGMTIVGQITSNICKDAGESTLSYAVDLSTKVAILIVALPIITAIFEFLGELLKV